MTWPDSHNEVSGDLWKLDYWKCLPYLSLDIFGIVKRTWETKFGGRFVLQRLIIDWSGIFFTCYFNFLRHFICLPCFSLRLTVSIGFHDIYTVSILSFSSSCFHHNYSSSTSLWFHAKSFFVHNCCTLYC